MPLPVLSNSASQESIVRLFHQTEHRWSESLAEPVQLEAGWAFASSTLSRVYDANVLSSAALPPGTSPKQAMELVQSHYRAQNTHCWKWILNPSASAEQTQPLIEHLRSSGHQPRSLEILRLNLRRQVPERSVPLQILPARSAYGLVRALAEQRAARWNEPQLTDASLLHLDDSHYDAFIGLLNGKPAAYAGVLAMGEIGRIDEVFVAPEFRRRGLAETLLGRVLEVCARAQFRYVLLSSPADNAPALGLFRKLGFVSVGEVKHWLAPGAALSPDPSR